MIEGVDEGREESVEAEIKSGSKELIKVQRKEGVKAEMKEGRKAWRQKLSQEARN